MLKVGTIVTVNAGVGIPLGVRTVSDERTGKISIISGNGKAAIVEFTSRTGNSTVTGAFGTNELTATTGQSQA